MDAISRAAGVGPTVEFLGKTYVVRGRGPGYSGAMEAEICRRRGDPMGLFLELSSIIGDRDEKTAETLITAAAHAVAQNFRNWRNATWEDYANFEQSAYGLAFMLWWAFNDPELTITGIRDVVLEASRRDGDGTSKWVKEAVSAIDQATGEWGNLTGRLPTPSQTAQPPGEASTAA